MALGDLRIIGDGKRGGDGKDGTGYEGHAREAGVNGINVSHFISNNREARRKRNISHRRGQCPNGSCLFKASP